MKSIIFPSAAGVDLAPALWAWGKWKVPKSVLQVQNWILNVNGFGDQTFSRSSIILIRKSRDTGRAERCSKFGFHQMPLPPLIKGACWWMRGGSAATSTQLWQCVLAIFCLVQVDPDAEDLSGHSLSDIQDQNSNIRAVIYAVMDFTQSFLKGCRALLVF